MILALFTGVVHGFFLPELVLRSISCEQYRDRRIIPTLEVHHIIEQEACVLFFLTGGVFRYKNSKKISLGH